MNIELYATNGESRSHTGVFNAGSGNPWGVAAEKLNVPAPAEAETLIWRDHRNLEIRDGAGTGHKGVFISAASTPMHALSIHSAGNKLAASASPSGETHIDWPVVEKLASDPTAQNVAVAVAKLLLAARAEVAPPYTETNVLEIGPHRTEEFRVYTQFTDAANWERVSFGPAYDDGRIPVIAEAAGAGCARLWPPAWIMGREIRLSADPTLLTPQDAAALKTELIARCEKGTTK